MCKNYKTRMYLHSVRAVSMRTVMLFIGLALIQLAEVEMKHLLCSWSQVGAGCAVYAV